ncbi:liver carboxylesterase 1-like [Paramacrobiotus metropolitanus]|uniref:liver carboxylesterase 1-like n=1 Tax=Paramacrobiotus metropolitanus TaxID=2943436 RepID=UPI0024459D90|nr:liver carboxylesterase 1-like [Paramacrobiotus metropolitanus]
MNQIMNFLRILFIWIVCVSFTAAENEQLSQEDHVQLTPEITLTGEKYSCERCLSKSGYVYYGIRYGVAKRFEHAEENHDFSYFSNPDRPKQGYVCPQHVTALPGFPLRNLTLNEDCLYLDVYVPSVKQSTKDKKLPVLFFIHGGGFQIGDKDLYNATELAGAVNAVVVTINYRVFAFGFLSSGDGAIKGNYGIGDAKVALKWVKKNVAKFGGDPEAITVFGESAGGALTSAVFLDKDVRESVRAGIAMSGSMLSSWSVNRAAKIGYDTVAKELGCLNASQAEVVQCLKDAPMEKLLKVTEFIGKNFTMWFMFAPVIDGEHVTEPPAQMISKQKQSESKREGTFITGFLREDSSLLMMLAQRDLFLPNSTFDFHVAKKIVTDNARLMHPCNLTDTVEQILRYYKLAENDDRPTTMRKTYHIVTDLTFGFPAIQEARVYANRSFSSEVHNQLYRISYDPNYNGLGSFHGLDLILLFHGPIKVLMANHTVDNEIIDNFRNMFHQVAHNGHLEGPNAGAGYVEFGQSGKWETGTEDFNDLSQFWTKQIENARSCATPPQLKDAASTKSA